MDLVPTDSAPVTPAVLRWARLSADVSVEEAAKRADVSTQRILEWEAGDGEPTLAKLRSLAKLYQRPLSVFFLDTEPRAFDVMRDFRRLPGRDGREWSRALHKVFRRAVEQREIAAELSADEAPPTRDIPTATVDSDPESAGQAARNALGVSLATQFSWRKPEAALAAWIGAVETLGILVLRTSDVSPKEMRGFSIGGSAPQVIVLNAQDWPRGQVFTLLHEFAHLMLREGGLCDLLEPRAPAARRIEVWCNAVAAATLMPKDAFLDNEIDGPAQVQEWDEDVLAQLADRWSVSRESVARRLLTLERATQAFYSAKRDEYLRLYDEEREAERQRRRSRESRGGPPPYRMTIRDRGKPYVRLVLDAYHRDALTPSSASNLLGLKLKHFKDLEREAGVGA